MRRSPPFASSSWLNERRYKSAYVRFGSFGDMRDRALKSKKSPEPDIKLRRAMSHARFV